MSAKTYPYKAWTLQPSFKPVEVELARSYGSVIYLGDVTEKGKYFHLRDLFATKEEAIADGWGRIKKMEADLQKRAENLAKKRASLNKASGQS